MEAALKDAWVDALRSGKHTQLRRELGSPERGFCAIGLLAFMTGDINGAGGYSSEMDRFLKKVKLPMESAWDIVRMNDNGFSFEKIADYVESFIPTDDDAFFKKRGAHESYKVYVTKDADKLPPSQVAQTWKWDDFPPKDANAFYLGEGHKWWLGKEVMPKPKPAQKSPAYLKALHKLWS